MIKLGREEPVASMDNSGKIIWAKQNEIQTVNIKAVPADFEVSIRFGGWIFTFLAVRVD